MNAVCETVRRDYFLLISSTAALALFVLLVVFIIVHFHRSLTSSCRQMNTADYRHLRKEKLDDSLGALGF